MAIFGRILRYVWKNTFLFYLVLCCFISFLIYAFYNFGTISTFSNNNNKFYHTEILDEKVKKMTGTNNEDKPKVEITLHGRREEVYPEVDGGSLDTPKKEEDAINILITFTKAEHNQNLQHKFSTTVDTMLRFSSVTLALHILGDNKSQNIARRIVNDSAKKYQKNCKVMELDIDSMATQLHEVVKEMQAHFSYKPGSYYSDSLFFLSIAMHQVMPENIHKVIMLDADLKFNADIKNLFELFNSFSSENVIGIGRENQPVYRHTFHMYRSKHPGTRVGDPPPNGLTGFNSGVLLLNLDKMRKSSLYNELVDANSVQNLTTKYMFKGHLGDQDFFTLLSLEHENLFYVLPCTWNRQLCIWWKDKGYDSVFNSYFQCEGHINIYHGNCNTQIPKLDWEQ